MAIVFNILAAAWWIWSAIWVVARVGPVGLASSGGIPLLLLTIPPVLALAALVDRERRFHVSDWRLSWNGTARAGDIVTDRTLITDIVAALATISLLLNNGPLLTAHSRQQSDLAVSGQSAVLVVEVLDVTLAPLAGATVEVRASSKRRGLIQTSVTDDEGTASFRLDKSMGYDVKAQ